MYLANRSVALKNVLLSPLQPFVGRMEEIAARLTHRQVSDGEFLKSLVRFDTIEQFLTSVKGDRPRFFINMANRKQLVLELEDVSPSLREKTIEEADKICRHIFDLLGSGPIKLDEFVENHGGRKACGYLPWHHDFKTGYQWNPQTYYKRIQSASYPGGYDIKIPWELSRCQHFVRLGQAYWFTSDERYAKEFVTQVLDWIAWNPPKFGVNWRGTMDVAIRAINWIWGYYFFKDSPSLNDFFRLVFFKSLLLHGRHIFENLEKGWLLSHNHYLADLAGLLYVGLLFPEAKEAHRWSSFALKELESEMLKQVYPDGVDFEASVSYHRLVTEMFLSTTILAQLNEHTFGKEYMGRLEKMIEFIKYCTKPDNTVPLIGDNDNGRLHRLAVWQSPEREWFDYQYLLAIGAVLFKRDDFGKVSSSAWQEALWLFNKQALMVLKNPNGSDSGLCFESRVYPDAGIYIMRDEDAFLAIDAGGVGQNGVGGHAHNDIFSFELYVAGRTWIVDPGTYVYTQDYEERQRFRSTAFHNTVMLGDHEQNRCVARTPFGMSNDAMITVLTWEANRSVNQFVGEHTGYLRLSDRVIHRREITFEKNQKVIFVRDWLISQKVNHSKCATVSFHFAPGVILSPNEFSCVMATSESPEKVTPRLILTWDKPVKISIHEYYAALSGYGTKQKAQRIVLSEIDDHLETRISWA